MERYSIDTDSLLWAWQAYPRDVASFKPVWETMERLIEEGTVMASEEVLEELAVKEGDEVHEWARTRPGLWHTSDEHVQRALRGILVKHRGIIDMGKNRSGGDPWVIAVAIVEGATVISEEDRNLRTPDTKPKIPDVCDRLNVRCIKFGEFVRDPAWQGAITS